MQNTRRPKWRRRHNEARGDGIKRKSRGGANRQTSWGARQSLGAPGEDPSGAQRTDQSDGIARDGIGRAKPANCPAQADQEYRRNVDPRPGYPPSETDCGLPRKLRQQYERPGHEGGTRHREARRVAREQRGQIQPLAHAVAQGKEPEQSRLVSLPRTIRNRNADAAQQNECQAIKEQDEVQLVAQKCSPMANRVPCLPNGQTPSSWSHAGMSALLASIDRHQMNQVNADFSECFTDSRKARSSGMEYTGRYGPPHVSPLGPSTR